MVIEISGKLIIVDDFHVFVGKFDFVENMEIVFVRLVDQWSSCVSGYSVGVYINLISFY